MRDGNRTLGSLLAAAGGASSGFDYLRIILACSVLVFHSVVSSYGDDMFLWRFPYRGVIALILPMFFSLSGFLVAGSYFRSKNILEFLLARIFRIFPALAVETALSALSLGTLVTVLPLSAYFQDPVFFRYFRNLYGQVQFHLPGVFTTNPFPGIVNQSLWTVPYELECYIALTVVALLGLLRYPRLLALLVVVMMIGLLGYNDLRGIMLTRVEPRLLVVCFMVGVLVFIWRDRVPAHGLIAGASAAIAYVFLSNQHGLYYLSPVPITYVTVWLGLQQPRRTWLVDSGDYSYGIYLYAFPIQQTYVWLFPEHRVWWLEAAAALAAVSIFAAFSWHVVEKPFLQLRHILVARSRARKV